MARLSGTRIPFCSYSSILDTLRNCWANGVAFFPHGTHSPHAKDPLQTAQHVTQTITANVYALQYRHKRWHDHLDNGKNLSQSSKNVLEMVEQGLAGLAVLTAMKRRNLHASSPVGARCSCECVVLAQHCICDNKKIGNTKTRETRCRHALCEDCTFQPCICTMLMTIASRMR